MVDMEVGEEHRLEPGKIKPRIHEGRWRPAATVDDEDSVVDYERRRNPGPAGDRHWCAGRSKEYQFSCHAPSSFLSVAFFWPLHLHTKWCPVGRDRCSGGLRRAICHLPLVCLSNLLVVADSRAIRR